MAIIGCLSLGEGSRKANIATVIQTAYDMGGREMHLRRSRQVPRRARCARRVAVGSGERVARTAKQPQGPARGALRSKVARGCAVSNKIESLVAEGKLSPSQAVRLHALAQLAYEGIMDDLAAGGGAATNAAPASASQGGCTDCSLPDASGGNGSGCSDCRPESAGASDGECRNEDANCGKCADCKARE